MSAPSKPGLLVGMLGLWVFLALAVPQAYLFGAQVLPRYQCDQECTLNHPAGFLTGTVLLVAVLLFAFAVPRAVRRQPKRQVPPTTTPPAPKHPPLIRQRIVEPPPPGGGGSSSLFARVFFYLLAAAIGAYLAFFIGAEHFSASFCSSPDFSGECDVGVAEGFVWAASWVGLVITLGLCIELQLVVNWYLRRTGRLST